MDSTEDSSKKGRFICEICQIVTTSQDQLENHFGGIKHKKMQAKSQTKGVSEYQCMTCDWRSLHFESYLEHKETVQHQIKEKMETSMEEDINGEEAVDDDCVDENEDDFFCNLCNVDSTSSAEAEKHIKSAAHQNELRLRKKQIKLEQEVKIEKFSKTCDLCDMKFDTEILYSTHLQCKRHLKNEKKAHTNLVKPLKCDICTDNFTDKIHLEKHFQSKRHLKSMKKCKKYGINVKLFDAIDKPSKDEYKILSIKSENVSLFKNSANNKIETFTHTKFKKSNDESFKRPLEKSREKLTPKTDNKLAKTFSQKAIAYPTAKLILKTNDNSSQKTVSVPADKSIQNTVNEQAEKSVIKYNEQSLQKTNIELVSKSAKQTCDERSERSQNIAIKSVSESAQNTVKKLAEKHVEIISKFNNTISPIMKTIEVCADDTKLTTEDQLKVEHKPNSPKIEWWYNCVYCHEQIIVESESEFRKHFELAKHSDNVMKTNLSCDSLCCKMCDVTKSTQSTFKQHLLSKVHIEMIVLRESIKAKTSLDDNPQPTMETKKIAPKKTTSLLDTYCKTCDYVFPTNVAYKKHLQSQGHIDKLLQLQFKDSQSANSEKVQDGTSGNEESVNEESVECSLCKITCSSHSQFCTHLSSSFPVTHESEFQSDYDEKKPKSLNLKAKSNIYMCNLCNIIFQSEYEHAIHLVSKKHCDREANLKLQDLQPKLKSNAPKPAHLTPGYGKAIYRCSFCNIECASNYEYNDHLLTPEHKEKQASFVRSSHVCKPCYISSNSEDEYRYHLASSSHKKNVEEIAEDNIQYLPKNLTTYECHYCALVCSTKNEYESHLLSNTHKMHMASLKVSLCTKFKCEICNLQYSTYQEFSSHQYSTKHRLTIEALERKQACHSVTSTSDHRQSYLHLDHSSLVTNSSVYGSIQSNVGATRSASGSFESFPQQGFSDRVASSVYMLPLKPKDVYSMPQQHDFALVDTSPQYINRRKESLLHKLENHTFRELDHLRVSKCQQLVSGDEDLWERRAAPAENRDQQFSFRAERMLVHKGAQPLAQAQSTSAVVPSPQYVSFEEFSFSRERQAILEHAHSQ